MEKLIPFNKPYLSGNETHYIKQAAEALKLSGDGMFTKKMPPVFRKKVWLSKMPAHYFLHRCIGNGEPTARHKAWR